MVVLRFQAFLFLQRFQVPPVLTDFRDDGFLIILGNSG